MLGRACAFSLAAALDFIIHNDNIYAIAVVLASLEKIDFAIKSFRQKTCQTHRTRDNCILYLYIKFGSHEMTMHRNMGRIENVYGILERTDYVVHDTI